MQQFVPAGVVGYHLAVCLHSLIIRAVLTQHEVAVLVSACFAEVAEEGFAVVICLVDAV